MKLTDIIREINNLDVMSQQRLLAHLQTSFGQSIHSEEPLIKEIAERKNERGFVCPHCQSTTAVRFGKYDVKNGAKTVQKQRYKCKECSRTFTDLTNTPLFRTRKIDKWLKFVDCMIEGHSLRKSAKLIGDISFVTLFYWRHKLLAALQQIPVEPFHGIVEMDETNFLFSEKGKRDIQAENLGKGAEKLQNAG
jgi:transposase-like protein